MQGLDLVEDVWKAGHVMECQIWSNADHCIKEWYSICWMLPYEIYKCYEWGWKTIVLSCECVMCTRTSESASVRICVCEYMHMCVHVDR